jgi:hypothetical protein
MMILQILSQKEAQVHEIADLLLKEELIANAMVGGEVQVKSKQKDGSIVATMHYRMQGISKSLLFQKINDRLKAIYKEKMPLLYSEPIILIDPTHQDAILESITKV